MAHINNDNRTKKINKYDSRITRKVYDLLNQGKRSLALKYTQDYIKEYPTDSVGLILYAKCMIGLDDEEAKSTCFRIIEGEIKAESKAKGEALFLLGNIERDHGNYLDAEKYYQQSADLGFLMAKHEVIKELITDYDYKSALDMIDSIDTSEYNVQTYLLKAFVLYHLKRYDEGLDVINQIDVSSVTKEKFLYNYTGIKATLCMVLDRNQEAEQILETYVKQSSPYNRNHSLLVDSLLVDYYLDSLLVDYYLNRKKIKEAYLLCRDIMENAGENIKLYTRSSLGDIYRELGNFDKAKEEYLKATDPSNSKERVSSAYISLGELSLLEEDYEQARKYFKKIDSSNIKFKTRRTIYLAIVELKLQNVNKAYKMLNKIDIRNIPPDLQNLYHQAEVTVMCEMEKRVDEDDYFTQQLLHYSKSSAIRHMDKHYKKCNRIAFFDRSIRSYSLFRLVSTLSENGTRIENSTVEKYLVPYKNVGYCNGETTHYMEVVMLPGTNHVLSMYPVKHISEEELQKQTSEVFQKQKTSSQIDKFNARYGKKG